MSWTTFPLSAFLVDKPGNAIKAAAWYENPIAMAGMMPDAPVMLGTWHPYNMVAAEDGADGEIWSFATDGAVTSIETPDFADGYEYRLELIDVTNSAGSSDLTLAAYYQTSAAYSAEGILRSFPASPAGQRTSGYASINRAFEASSTHAVDFAAGGVNSTGIGVEGVSAFSGALFFTHTTAQRIGKARLSISAGTFNGGKVLLMRRKLYA